jgi:hypothetical protein
MNKKECRKDIYQFRFKKMDHFQMVDLVNREFPLSLASYEHIIDRIHKRYPLIDKPTVAMIIRKVLEGIRRLLILGRHVSITNLVSVMKLLFIRRRGIVAKISLFAPTTIEEGND